MVEVTITGITSRSVLFSIRDTSSVAALWKIKVDLVDWFGYPLLVYHCNGAGREHHTGGHRILPDTLYLPTHDRQILLIF